MKFETIKRTIIDDMKSKELWIPSLTDFRTNIINIKDNSKEKTRQMYSDQNHIYFISLHISK